MVDHCLKPVCGIHQRQQRVQLGADGLLGQQLHGVVVFRQRPLALLGQVLFAPLDALFAARADDPRPRDVDHVLLIRQAEHGKMQLKHTLQQQQCVVGQVVQDALAKILPVKLRVQRPAQPVVKLVQPLEGRRDPGELNIMDGEQLFHCLNEIDLHSKWFSLRNGILVFYHKRTENTTPGIVQSIADVTKEPPPGETGGADVKTFPL